MHMDHNDCCKSDISLLISQAEIEHLYIITINIYKLGEAVKVISSTAQKCTNTE